MKSKSQVLRKGFGSDAALGEALKKEYRAPLIQNLRESGGVYSGGRVMFHLAQEFGFCYGVDRAVEYAYATCARFPERRVYLIGEIIHNPYVNKRLTEKGVIRIRLSELTPERMSDFCGEDIIIIPAFGIPFDVFENLKNLGCTLVDTTCGSVLNVWKAVERYSKAGITSIIHGKYSHEETRATTSHITRFENGKYIVILDRVEAEKVAACIRGDVSLEKFLLDFSEKIPSSFDMDTDFKKMGFANQTTMLADDSRNIASIIRAALSNRYGKEWAAKNFHDLETICSATQDRQDAVRELLRNYRCDLMIVIGGYNSSNTRHLFEISAEHLPAYHISHAECIIDAERIKNRPMGKDEETTSYNWLKEGNIHIGITAGASTPDFLVDQTLQRILRVSGSIPDTV